MSIHLIFSGRTHKESETMTDCQDFFHLNSQQNCFAIADGASQSFYPSLWAELLVNHFCQNPDIDQENWELWLKPIQEEWLQKVKEKVETAQREVNPVWVTNTNRLNRRDSATSTFIGLEFLENYIKVSLVGDSCLFIVKNNQYKNALIASYPIENSQDFGNRPEYFASYEKNNDFQPTFLNIPLEKPSNSEEKYYFILATDALSEFIFQCLENNKDIWSYLITISSENDFESFIKEARNSNDVKMKNDDVTLMILEVNNIKINQPLPFLSSPILNSPEEEINYPEKKENLSLKIPQFNDNQDDDNLPSDKENDFVESARNFVIIKFVAILEVIKTQINRNLKLQRNILLILVSLLFPLSLFTYFLGKNSVNQSMVNSNEQNFNSENVPDNSDSSSDSNQKLPDNQNNIDLSTPDEPEINEPQFTEIEVGTTIYTDEQLLDILIESTQTKVKAQIIETGDDWLKIMRNVYSHKSTSIDRNCANKEITLTENIRIEPDKNAQLFGKLIQPSQFKNVDINSELTWCKFQFEGYIKK